MGEILVVFFTVILLLVSVFIVLVVLMQRPSANSGMGSALGGGAAESAFGAQTGNVLTRATIIACVAFFVLAFSLYLGYMADVQEPGTDAEVLTESLKAMHPVEEDTAGQAEDSSLTDLSGLDLPEGVLDAVKNGGFDDVEALPSIPLPDDSAPADKAKSE